MNSNLKVIGMRKDLEKIWFQLQLILGPETAVKWDDDTQPVQTFVALVFAPCSIPLLFSV